MRSHLSSLLEWRWAPSVALVAGSLSFVALALALVPDHLGTAPAAALEFGSAPSQVRVSSNSLVPSEPAVQKRVPIPVEVPAPRAQVAPIEVPRPEPIEPPVAQPAEVPVPETPTLLDEPRVLENLPLPRYTPSPASARERHARRLHQQQRALSATARTAAARTADATTTPMPSVALPGAIGPTAPGTPEVPASSSDAPQAAPNAL